MKPDTLAFVAFGAVLLLCSVVFLGFVLIAWLGLSLGLMWMVAVTPAALFGLYLLYRYTGLGTHGGPPP